MFRRISKILGAMTPNAPQTLLVGDRIEMENLTWGVVAVIESPEPDKQGWHALCVAERKEPTPLPMMRRRWIPLAA